jgi:hypothetical protein
MRVIDQFEVWGHPNIKASNRRTFEFTKESHLTIRGDCVIGIRASKGARELTVQFKELARNPSALITIEVVADSLSAIAVGRGSPNLTFSHPTDLVGRKSVYACSRTLMIRANKAAKDFPRELIEALRNPEQRAQVTLIAEL